MKNRVFCKLKEVLPMLLLCGAGLALTACFDDSDPIAEQYKEWKEQNEQYLAEAEAQIDADGKPYYTKIVPDWAPNAYVLMHWHNDRTQTENNLSPMDNSTVSITYELFDIEGKRISDSFSNIDSLYTSRPSSNIIGVWAGLTHMHIGDSVTMVMPADAGYGEYPNQGIKPYSTLIYNIKLKAIPAYEVP